MSCGRVGRLARKLSLGARGREATLDAQPEPEVTAAADGAEAPKRGLEEAVA